MTLFKKILMGFIVLNCSIGLASSLPEAKVTIKVIDEDGKPIHGATVGVGFTAPSAQDPTTTGIQGVTDEKGMFTATNPTFLRVSYGVSMEGFYYSNQQYLFQNPKGGKWQPWNPTLEVVLKKIIKPVAMYARKLQIELPELDKPIGFDLVEYDWVSPYGKGHVGDLIFQAKRRYVNWQDYDAELKIGFSNSADGLIPVSAPYTYESELRLPHQAPESGYENQVTFSKSRSPGQPGKTYTKVDQNFFFRVRTALDSKGNIRKAMYGKIHGNIDFDVIDAKTAVILFSYFLNPDGTRNVEFDIHQNLFQNLERTEGPVGL